MLIEAAEAVSQWGTIAGMMTAGATLLTAVGAIITVVKVLLPTKRKIESSERQIQDVHLIVNQQRTDMEQYNKALKRALAVAGIEIPEDQSKLDDSPVGIYRK